MDKTGEGFSNSNICLLNTQKKDISNCDRMYVENIPLSLLKNVSTNRNVHLVENPFRAGSDTI